MSGGFGNISPFMTSWGYASATSGGVLTAGTQTLGGNKTWVVPKVDSSAETLATWRLDEDTSSTLVFMNGTSTNASFIPQIRGTNSAAAIALSLLGAATTVTGTNPVIRLDASTAGDAAITGRPTHVFSNNRTPALSISATGVTIFGSSSVVNGARLGQKLETNTSADFGGATFGSWSTTASQGSIVDFIRSKSATIGTNTVLASGDMIGALNWRGSGGSAMHDAASIFVHVDGTPGASDMPGRMTFWTTPDGSATVAERARITNAGDVGIGKTPTTGIILDVNGQLGLKSYTVATLPSASVQAGAMVYASDAAVAPCVAFSTGTNWKRCDNAATTVV